TEKQDELQQTTRNLTAVDSELEKIKSDIRTIQKDLQSNPDDATKQRTLQDHNTMYEQKGKEKVELVRQKKELELEFTGLNNEIAFLEELNTEMNKNQESPDAVAERTNMLDKQELANEVKDKEFEADAKFVESISNEVSPVKTTLNNELAELKNTSTHGTTNTENKTGDNNASVSSSNPPPVLTDYTENDFSKPEAKKYFQLGKNHESIAKTLRSQANEKRTTLNTIDDELEKELLKEQIEELENLADYRQQQANDSYNKAFEEEGISSGTSDLVALNTSETATSTETETETHTETSTETVTETGTETETGTVITTENKDPVKDNPAYPFYGEPSVQGDYEKAIFYAQNYENLAAEEEEKATQMESNIDTIADNQTKTALTEQIKELRKSAADNRNKARASYSKAEEIKNKNPDLIEEEIISPDVLALKAASYEPEMEVPMSREDQQKLVEAKDGRSKADDHYFIIEAHKENLMTLKESLSTVIGTPEEKNIAGQMDEIKSMAEEDFRSFTRETAVSNKEEYSVYYDLLDRNRLVAENPDLKLAYNLEKEANIFFDKSAFIRNNVLLGEDFLDNIERIEKANNLELSAIEKQQHALDLYLKARKEGIGKPAAEPIAYHEERKEITLLTEEQEQIKKYKDNIDIALNLEKESERMLAGIAEKKKAAEKVYSEKEKDKILKGVIEEEAKASENNLLAAAYHRKADSLKYSLYQDQIGQLYESLNNVGNNKKLADQYIKEADFYYSEAQTIYDNALKLSDLQTREKESMRAKKFEKQALASQEIALDLLMEVEPQTFIKEQGLVIVDRLEMLDQPVDVSEVKKYREDKIIEKIELQELDLKTLDEAKKASEEGDTYLSSVESIEMDIKANEEILNSTSASNKEKKNAKKMLPKLQKQRRDFSFAAQESYELANDGRYMVFKENFNNVRLKGNTDEARMGKQLEKDADKSYDEAKKIRDKAFFEPDDKKAYDLISQARDLEMQAIEKQHSAYGIYLGLPTMEEDSMMLAMKRRVSEGISEDDIIKKDADIVPITPVNDTANLLALDRETENMTTKTTENTETDLNDLNLSETETGTTETGTNETGTTETGTTETGTTETGTTETETTETGTTETGTSETETTETGTTETGTIKTTETSTNYSGSDAAKEIADLLIARGYGYGFRRNITYTDRSPIPENPPCPGNQTFFKIQVGAFKSEIRQEVFNGLVPVCKETRPGSEWTRILVGQFRTHQGANFALQEVRGMGFRDAFVVAYKNCGRIPFYQAQNESTSGSRQEQDEYKLYAQVEVELLRNKGTYTGGTVPRTTSGTIAGTSTTGTTGASTTGASTTVFNRARDLKAVKGLLYTVQIGVYRNNVTKEQLLNLDPIYKDVINTDMIRYTTGIFTDEAQARRERDRIRQLGIPDAFVIAYRDGQRMNVGEARRIIEDQGRGAYTTEGGNASSAGRTTAGSAEVYYRVQIGAYKNEVPTGVVSQFLTVAANQGLDQMKATDGSTLYLVGKFKSYNEASTKKDVLVNQGIADAFVVAYKGQVKISVNEAKEILGK
ncbi:MAG: hypothetical protein KJ607_10700, partial [Bacteroidetes bacterium]|nr:hypothetical protein [Bacteroidota bacterium]